MIFPSVRQRGFGIVELMIGLAIGAVLVVLVTDMFNANKAVQNRILSQSRLQENARFAMMFLSSEIRKVGYRTVAEEIPQYAFRGYDFELIEAWDGDDDDDDVFARHSTTTISIHGVDVNLSFVADDSDVLMLTRQVESDRVNCLGNATAGDGSLAVSIYYVRVSNASATNKASRFGLYCKPVDIVYSGGDVVSVNKDLPAAQLVEDVTNMQLLLARDSDGSGVPNSYVTPSSNMGVSNGIDVVAVDVQLTVKGGRTVDLLETNEATTLSMSERALTLTIGGTVAYRSKAP